MSLLSQKFSWSFQYRYNLAGNYIWCCLFTVALSPRDEIRFWKLPLLQKISFIRYFLYNFLGNKFSYISPFSIEKSQFSIQVVFAKIHNFSEIIHLLTVQCESPVYIQNAKPCDYNKIWNIFLEGTRRESTIF